MSVSMGEVIRNARKAKNLSQEQLGELIGANRVTISKYESGAYFPSVPAFERLSSALGVTLSELINPQSNAENPSLEAKKEPAPAGGMRESVKRLFDEISAAGLSDEEAEYIRSLVSGVKALRKP